MSNWAVYTCVISISIVEDAESLTWKGVTLESFPPCFFSPLLRMAGLSGPLTETRAQKVLFFVDTNAALLQSPSIAGQISSAIDRVLWGFTDVSRRVWWGSKFIDSSVSSVCYERRLRECNNELKRVALQTPTFRPLIPEPKPILKDESGRVLVESLQVKEDTSAPYESFHQAVRELTPPIQAVSESHSWPSKWKHISAPIREALLVFPWDTDEFPESPPQTHDGESSVTVSLGEQTSLKEDLILIFTALPATPAASQSFVGGSPDNPGEEREYRKTLGALKEAAKLRGIQLLIVNTAVAHGEGHGKTAEDAGIDNLESVTQGAGIWTIPLQALAFGGDIAPASATLPALFGLPVKPVAESPVCNAFFGEISTQLFQQLPNSSPKPPPALAVFGPSATVALLRTSASCEKWYQAPRKDLDRQERYALRSVGGGQAAADFADVLCQLNDHHSVLFLKVEDEAFAFEAILEPCSPSCATLTLRHDKRLGWAQMQLGFLPESAWKADSCQLVDAVAEKIRRMHVAYKAQFELERKLAALPGKDCSEAPEEAPREQVVERRAELPQTQKLPLAAEILLPGHRWGGKEADYWQSGGGKKHSQRRRSKERAEGSKGSHRRSREGTDTAGRSQRRRKSELVEGAEKVEGVEKGEEALRPQEEEAESGRKEGPQRSENKSASAGQTSSDFLLVSFTEVARPVPSSFKSRVGGRQVAALLGQQAVGGTAAPSQVPKAPPARPPRLPAGPAARQPGSGTRPLADVSTHERMRHAPPASGRGLPSAAQEDLQARQPGSGRPLADVSRRRGHAASGRGHLSPAQEDPEAVLKGLKEQAREFAKGGTEGSAADFARQVVRKAGRVLIKKGQEGGASGPPKKEGPSGRGGGNHGDSSQALVVYDPLANGGVVKAGSEGGRVGQDLKRLFLLPPKKLTKKYVGCRVPGEGSSGKNKEGYSVDDKIREHTLQIFLRLEILWADPPHWRTLADSDTETAQAKLQRSLVTEITELLKNVAPNLAAGSPEQDFLDREVKPRYGSKLPDVLNHVYLDNELSAPFPEWLKPPAARKREGGVKRLRKRKLKRAPLAPLEPDVNTLLLQEREDRRARTNGESQFAPIDPKRVITQQLVLPKPPRGKDKLRQSSRQLQGLFSSEPAGFRSAPSGIRSDQSGSPPQTSSDLTGFLRERKQVVGARLSARGERSGGPGDPSSGAPPNGGALALLGPPESAAADVGNGLRRGFADVSDEAPLPSRADRAPAEGQLGAAVRGNRAFGGGMDATKALQMGGVAVAAGAQAPGERQSRRLWSTLKESRPADKGEGPDRGLTSLAPGQLFALEGVERPSLGGEEEEWEDEVEATPWKAGDVDEEDGSERESQESPGKMTGLNLESVLDRAGARESPVETTGFEGESEEGVLRTGDPAEDSGAQAESEKAPLAVATSLPEAPLDEDVSGGPEGEAVPEAGGHVEVKHEVISAPPEAVQEERPPPKREAAGDAPTSEAKPEATPEKQSPSFETPSQDPIHTPGDTPLTRQEEPSSEETTPPSKRGRGQGSLGKRKRGKGSAVGRRTRASTSGDGGLRSGRKLRKPDPTWFKARKTPPKAARELDCGEKRASDRKRDPTIGTESPGVEASAKVCAPESGESGASERKQRRTSGTETPNRGASMELEGGSVGVRLVSKKGASGKCTPVGGSAPGEKASEEECPVGVASEKQPPGGGLGPMLTRRRGLGKDSAESSPGDGHPKRPSEPAEASPSSVQGGSSAPTSDATPPPRSRTPLAQRDPPDESPLRRYSNGKAARARGKAECGGTDEETRGNATKDEGEGFKPVETGDQPRWSTRQSPLASACVPDSAQKRASSRKRKRTSENGTPGGAASDSTDGGAVGTGGVATLVTSACVSDTIGSARKRKRPSGNGTPEGAASGTVERASVGNETWPEPVSEKAGSAKGAPGGKVALGKKASGEQRAMEGKGMGKSKHRGSGILGAGKVSSVKGEGCSEPQAGHVFAASPSLTSGDQSPGSLDLPPNQGSKFHPGKTQPFVKRPTLPSASPSPGASVRRETRAGGKAKEAASAPAGKGTAGERETGTAAETANEPARKETRAWREAKKAASTPAGRVTRPDGKAEDSAAIPGGGGTRAGGNVEEVAASPGARETRAGADVQEAAATPVGKETKAEEEAEGAAATPGRRTTRAGGKVDEAAATPVGKETRAEGDAEGAAATPVGRGTRAGRKPEKTPTGKATEARGNKEEVNATPVERRTRAEGKAEAVSTGGETRAGRKTESITVAPDGKELRAREMVQKGNAATVGKETRAEGKVLEAGATRGLVTPGKAPGLRSETKARELSGSSLRSGKKLPPTSAFVPDSEEKQSSARKRKRTSEDGTAASERSDGGSVRGAAANGSASKKVVFRNEVPGGAGFVPGGKASGMERTVARASEKSPGEEGATGKTRSAKVTQTARTRNEPELGKDPAAFDRGARRKSSAKEGLGSESSGGRDAKTASPVAAAPGKGTRFTDPPKKASPADGAPKTVSPSKVGPKKQSPVSGKSGEKAPGKKVEKGARGTPGTRASKRGKSGKRRSERMSLTGEAGETMERAKRRKEAAFEAWEGH
ncbi:hypothetical protein KFL_005720080 [Klebsormidium nitens]|uniref:Uncharacterized protein n=1 Tax=Klebsormidium nitens TaxID=105231 RepID=A0A1Y1IP34_KLENI|nr:hypothetical protein KFL_005720080 [Klebsormidium nitens]|eukprot:GAQ89878.1 hypothetical protein KFL_005720080 [Klebsormidium nitens]